VPDLVVLRPVPSWRRGSTLFVVLGAVATALVLALLGFAGRWNFSPMLLLGVGYLVRGLLLRRARVVVDEEGVLVHTGGLRPSFSAWVDVSELSVDPPGGPRVVRLRRRDGSELPLPELSEEDRARLFDARPR